MAQELTISLDTRAVSVMSGELARIVEAIGVRGDAASLAYGRRLARALGKADVIDLVEVEPGRLAARLGPEVGGLIHEARLRGLLEG